ncbi:beta-ketoacyl-[acyl-carrier-protein] synthase family protein [Lentisphaerota bacterium ZTH]|nr:beta-ketoacyl-[acyl-carrier-protein] synthase family protein [Lentisphaerota bacterium]WET06620.1 beta-ketoacyl-[acyl-carrier-protein] synthase family protein [Lentisphaerota bacterium ZTH]
MNEVFITGRGLVTPLGNGIEVNKAALYEGRSGITFVKEWAEYNLKSQVGGIADREITCPLLDRKRLRFAPANAIMSANAVYEALNEAGISLEEIPSLRVAVIGGVAGSNYLEIYQNTAAYADSHNLRKINPCIVPRVMPSSAVSNLSLLFGFTGESYDISAACASSASSVMMGARLIASGEYDIVVCGGAEQTDWVQALGFTAIRALSKKYNSCPEKASRPFDRDRDGFVLAEGAGYMILESEASVKRRGVTPFSRITGFCANSNATDMVVPDAKSSADIMRCAVKAAGLKPGDVAYLNTHGTATPVGDPVEMEAVKEVFGDNIAINSTKSQTGHMIGATGAVEIIFTSIMIENSFISPSLNLENPEEEFHWADFVTETRNVRIKHALSNSFAFGGSNVSLIVSAC